MILTLEAARKEAGFTIKEAAAQCGISVIKMEKYEDSPGTMRASTAIKLRKLYNVPIDYIDLS